MKLGIIGAMEEEISLLRQAISITKETEISGRVFYEGMINSVQVVLVLARIGKVAAAITTTILLREYNVDAIIFTGVAGAVDDDLNIGDIIISERLVYHDMDASPIFPQYHIPLLNIDFIEAEQQIYNLATKAAKKYIQQNLLDDVKKEDLTELGIEQPRVLLGAIATGDQFIKSADTTLKIKCDLKCVKCVEMEGAAVAQVCYEFNVPFVVIRIISDRADHSANIDFTSFLKIASNFSRGIIKNFVEVI